MRIGTTENFLWLERVVPQSATEVVWRLEAQSARPDCRFVSVHEHVRIDAGEESRRQVRDFLALSLYRIEISFSEGGWLRLNRDLRGHILVRYRVNCLRAGSAMEGEIVLEGEAATGLGQQIQTLFA